MWRIHCSYPPGAAGSSIRWLAAFVDDYPQDKRIAIDRALGQACDRTKQDVRGALLKIEHVAIARRVRSFVHEHLEPSFFREEAVGKGIRLGVPGSIIACDTPMIFDQNTYMVLRNCLGP